MTTQIRYDELEQLFLNDFDGEHVNLHEIFRDDPQTDRAEIEKLQVEMNETSKALSRITAAIERGDAPDELLSRMRELSAKQKLQAAELDRARAKAAEFASLDEGMEREQVRFDELLEAHTVDARLAIRQHIRRIVSRVEVFPQGVGARSTEWQAESLDAKAMAFAVTYATGAQRLFVHPGPGRLTIYIRRKS